MGISNLDYTEVNTDIFAYGLSIAVNKKVVVDFGLVNPKILKAFDINQEVFYADFNWNVLFELSGKTKITFKELSKYPAVRRDLSLLIDKPVKFEQIEQLAFQNERELLKQVNLFDVYQGDKLPEGKKSYAVSFIIQDEEKTLTDKQIDKIMDKFQKSFQDKLGAVLRG